MTIGITSPTASKISPNAKLMSSETLPDMQIVHIGKVIVRMSTVDYSIKQDVNELSSASLPVMRLAQPEFLQAYYNVVKLTGSYDLKTFLNTDVSSNLDSSVRINQKILSSQAFSAIQSLQGTNDSAEAVGFVDSFSESYNVNDLKATTEYDFNATQMLNYQPLEAKYQSLANYTSGKETDDAFLPSDKAVTDNMNFKTFVSGFSNIESGVFDVLKANLAANYSTPADQLSPDRITIISYDLSNANKTIYFTQNFQDRVRAVVSNEILNKNVAVAFKISLFGINLFNGFTVMKASAFSLPTVFSDIINVGKTIVSAPLKVATDIKAELLDKPIAAISSTIGKGLTEAKSLVSQALSAPQNIVKTIGDTAGSFVGKVATAATPLVSAAGKLATSAITGVVGLGQGLLGQLPLIAGILGVILVVGLVAYFLFFRESPINPS